MKPWKDTGKGGRMRDKDKKERKNGLTRRDFIKRTGILGAALGTAAIAPHSLGKAFASERDYILIGRPNPSTGPLSGFGEASPWVETRAIDAMNKKGGVYVEEVRKNLPVRMKLVDTESNPTKTAEMASGLILKDKVDIMLAMHTVASVNPISGVCERFGVPCISTDAPTDSWLHGKFQNWCFHAFWTVDSVTDLYMGLWDEHAHETNKIVGFLFPNDETGVQWSEMFLKKLPAKGYKVIDTGRFPPMTPEFSGTISRFKAAQVEIIAGCVIPPDFSTFWRQSRQQGFIPKIVTVGKAIAAPPDVTSLGSNLAMGLTLELIWSPNHPFKSSLTGETAKDLCDAWTNETKKQWTPAIGFKHAAMEIAFDVLKRAQSVNREKIKKAILETDMDTIVGHIKYNEQHYSEIPLVAGQWVKGQKWPWEVEIVYNKKHPQIPKTAKMIFPIPR
jgi:branched-chain amino acid transport system substrate-binding protein